LVGFSHRVLRHTAELTMCQSLQLTSMAVWPAGHSKKDHLDSVTLSLEVLNTNTVSAMLLLVTSELTLWKPDLTLE